MTKHSTAHGTFRIERTYDATPARVFAAWSTAEAKSRWFAGPDQWKMLIREMDFRVGGQERLRGRFANGMISDFQCTYHDIVPERRIVYAYDMYIDDTKISVSLATIELEPADPGTRLVLTEQGAFLDGYDDAGKREHGSGLLLDKLGESLRQGAATAP
jgi:uncharacterized protein YndB with AHSA1/START domain